MQVLDLSGTKFFGENLNVPNLSLSRLEDLSLMGCANLTDAGLYKLLRRGHYFLEIVSKI